jgi:ribonuclease HII
MPDFSVENSLGLQEKAAIAGVDEVGRGPLAGPVTAAALVINRTRSLGALSVLIDDSKRLSASRRTALAPVIQTIATVGLGWASREEIDRLNILGATMLAMRRAVEQLTMRLEGPVDFALIDGNRDPGLACPSRTVVKGDGLSLSIAAASIVAKVARDRAMADLAARHPGYGWERNAGYGTAEHLAALDRLGPTPEHRRSFAPVWAAAKKFDCTL